VSDVVQRLLAALNAHDIDAFLACSAPEATIENGPDRVAASRHAESRERLRA
jgi:hypothetical protein